MPSALSEIGFPCSLRLRGPQATSMQSVPGSGTNPVPLFMSADRAHRLEKAREPADCDSKATSGPRYAMTGRSMRCEVQLVNTLHCELRLTQLFCSGPKMFRHLLKGRMVVCTFVHSPALYATPCVLQELHTQRSIVGLFVSATPSDDLEEIQDRRLMLSVI